MKLLDKTYFNQEIEISYNPLLVFRNNEFFEIYDSLPSDTGKNYIYLVSLNEVKLPENLISYKNTTKYSIVAGQLIDNKFAYINVNDYEKSIIGDCLTYLMNQGKYKPNTFVFLSIEKESEKI